MLQVAFQEVGSHSILSRTAASSFNERTIQKIMHTCRRHWSVCRVRVQHLKQQETQAVLTLWVTGDACAWRQNFNTLCFSTLAVPKYIQSVQEIVLSSFGYIRQSRGRSECVYHAFLFCYVDSYVTSDGAEIEIGTVSFDN